MIKIICIAMIVLLASCDQAPKIDYHEPVDTTMVVDDRLSDTTKILVAELPFKFDSTGVLIFTVRFVDLLERGGYSKIGSDSYSNHENFSHGNFMNLVFEDKEGNRRKLTDSKVLVRNIKFLEEIFKTTKAGYILYFVTDRDSNGDKELNHVDLEALYISKVDGTDFRKLTKELHEFYDYKIIKEDKRVYFRTLEDRDRDGKLTTKDVFHHYYIEFSSGGYMVTEYNPLDVFE